MSKHIQKYKHKITDKLLDKIALFSPAKKVAENAAFVVVALFKNEADILRGWLEFYLNQRVDHIYLIDNCSTDHSVAIIQEFMPSQRITVLKSRYRKTNVFRQAKEYNLAAQRVHEVYPNSFVAFLDIDEFLYAPTDRQTDRQTI